MTKKIKVALIYKKNFSFLSKEHFDKTTYYFFMDALKRNPELDVKYFPVDKTFDTKNLENDFQVILLPENYTFGSPDELYGIDDLDIPVISRVGDFHDEKRYGKIKFHKKFKIDYYFNFMNESYFYKFYPRKFRYKTILFGIEPNLYTNDMPFDSRIDNKILNSGAIGKTTIKSRMANRILNPKKSGWYFYKLRTLCNNLSYVDYFGMKNNNYQYQNYQSLLTNYKASIAATTYYPTIKYWESAAAGCLTFMEITEKNNGSYLGFEDGKNAIFIDEKNYEQ